MYEHMENKVQNIFAFLKFLLRCLTCKIIKIGWMCVLYEYNNILIDFSVCKTFICVNELVYFNIKHMKN